MYCRGTSYSIPGAAMLNDYRAALRWSRAQSKVNNAVGVLSKHGLGFSRTDGVIGDPGKVSRRESKKISAATDTMDRFKAGFFTEKQQFKPENPLAPIRYTPIKFADYANVQKKSLEQLSESMHLRAGVKFLQRANFDPRLQAHPNRRILNISPEDAQNWSSNIESLWRDDKESKSWDESFQNNYPQIADMALWSYVGIGEFFCIRRAYFNDADRITNISLQMISPFQIKSPYWYGSHSINCYNYNGHSLVAIPAGDFLGSIEDGNYVESGIEYNSKNEEIAIYIEPSRFGEDWIRIPCKTESGFQQVLHGFKQSDPGQKRGMAESATAWHEYCNIRDLCLFELESARLNTVVAGTVTADSNAQPNGRSGMDKIGEINWDAVDGEGSTLAAYEDPGYSVRSVEGGGFIVQNFTPGYKYQELSTSRPNVNIPKYIDELLKYIYPSNFGLAITVVNHKFEGSYNASKGAIDLSWKNGVEYELKQFSSDFHRPNYSAWLAGKVATGETIAPGWEIPRSRNAWASMSIITPPRPSLNPFQEARAAAMKIKEGVSNREYESQQLTGTSAEENAERLRGENEKLSFANEPLSEKETSGNA